MKNLANQRHLSTINNPNLKNFHQWIRDPIKLLSQQKHNGFAVSMIAFPVLERWIRGKVGIKNRRLREDDGERFYNELAIQFGALRDPEDGSFPNVAKAFWELFRHGILHQATFSTKPIKICIDEKWVSCAFVELGVPIVTQHPPPSFQLDPYSFAKTVLSIVERDFNFYEAADPDHHNLATVANDTTHSWIQAMVEPRSKDVPKLTA